MVAILSRGRWVSRRQAQNNADFIGKWVLMGKQQWHLNGIIKIFIHENVLKFFARKMSAILFWHHSVSPCARLLAKYIQSIMGRLLHLQYTMIKHVSI